MTLTRIVVAALVVTAATARAEEPGPEPTWSLGAGLSYNSSIGLLNLGALGAGNTVGGLGGLSVAQAPSLAPNVSLERAFSNHFALGLGLEGGVTTLSTVGPPQPPPTFGSVGIGLSPRFTLTSASAPVAFTVFTTLAVGYSAAGAVLSIASLVPGDLKWSSQALSVGAMGGIALEKRFFERLAVRVQAQLARMTLNRGWTTTQSVDPSTGAVVDGRSVGSVVSANVVPSPSIELRLYL